MPSAMRKACPLPTACRFMHACEALPLYTTHGHVNAPYAPPSASQRAHRYPSHTACTLRIIHILQSDPLGQPT